MEYKVNDTKLVASTFIPFVNQIWRGNYDLELTQVALSKTLNITAYDNKTLVECLRILTDGYFFGTITELLVLLEYQFISENKFKTPNRRSDTDTVAEAPKLPSLRLVHFGG